MSILTTFITSSLAIKCNHVQSFYQEHACCSDPNGQFSTPQCDLAEFQTINAKRLYHGGFKSSLASALDAFMENGALLNKFPMSPENTTFSATNFVSISARKGHDEFHRTYGVNSKTGVAYPHDAEVPSIYYSSTKLIANIVGTMFMERAVIGLDEPVWRYLPEYHSDGDVTNQLSVYPLHVIRPLPLGTPEDATTVTVDGTVFNIKTHSFTNFPAGDVKYYEEPVPLSDYPTLRQFMTHTDGSAGYGAFVAPLYGTASEIPRNFLAHAVTVDMEMVAYGATDPLAYYGPFFTVGLFGDRLSVPMVAHAQFGKLVLYPGKGSHYSWSNAVVGRISEVAYAKYNGHTVSDDSIRFQDVAKEMLWDKVGVDKSAFSIPTTSPLYPYYNSSYAYGVTSTATAESSKDTPNWSLGAGSFRDAFATYSITALGDMGMYSTAKDYLKMMSLLLNGLAPDGTRLMRDSTARLLSTIPMSHTFDEAEHEKSGNLYRDIPTIRTLGGAVMSERLHPYRFDDAYISGVHTYGDMNYVGHMSSDGLDLTSWGGAAGTKWTVDTNANYLYSFQTNVASSPGPHWLSEQISGLIQDHTF